MVVDRKVILKALVGSHNYNLNTEESDRDYKVFVIPTFEDLYNNEVYSNQVIGEHEDLDIHDVRKLVDLFFKSNINFIEVLYSSELLVPNNILNTQRELILELLSYKKDIVRMNLPYLFNACYGMHFNKMKLLLKGTEGTQHLVDSFGMDTKQALHAYRVLNFLERFHDTHFEDFKYAMTYDSIGRKEMLDIRNGKYSFDEFTNMANSYREEVIDSLKDDYHSFEPSIELKERIESIIMKIVKSSIADANMK